MKKALAIIISLLICTLCACAPGGSPPGTMATEQTQPPTESTEVSTTAAPTTEAATEEQTTQPSETEGTHPQNINEAASAPTRQTESTEPLPTQSAQEETKQPETQPPVTEPPTTEAATEETQSANDPTEETTEETHPETAPEPFEPDYAFKREVAAYAASTSISTGQALVRCYRECPKWHSTGLVSFATTSHTAPQISELPLPTMSTAGGSMPRLPVRMKVTAIMSPTHPKRFAEDLREPMQRL